MISLLLVIACVCSVWYLSSQPAQKSNHLSISVTEIIIEEMPDYNNLPQAEQHQQVVVLNEVIRSLAHFCLFLLAGFSVAMCLYSYHSPRIIVPAILLCIGWAVVDELYQEFCINGRGYQFADLLKDWLGSIIGIMIFVSFAQIIKHFKNKNSSEM